MLNQQQPVEVDRSGQSLGAPPQGFTLKPGAGSWKFNSIEEREHRRLPPTHIPRDLMSGSSETVYSTTTSQARPTIPPIFKEILRNSADYQIWLQLKNEFLRERKMLFDKANLDDSDKQQFENFPRNKGSNAQPTLDNALNDKFPHFPETVSNALGKDVRPQREIKVNLLINLMKSGWNKKYLGG